MSDLAQLRKRARRAHVAVQAAEDRMARMQLALHLRKLQMEIPEVRAFLDRAIEWHEKGGGTGVEARLRADYRLPALSAARRAALIDRLVAEGGVGGLLPTLARKRRHAERLVALFEAEVCTAAPPPASASPAADGQEESAAAVGEERAGDEIAVAESGRLEKVDAAPGEAGPEASRIEAIYRAAS